MQPCALKCPTPSKISIARRDGNLAALDSAVDQLDGLKFKQFSQCGRSAQWGKVNQFSNFVDVISGKENGGGAKDVAALMHSYLESNPDVKKELLENVTQGTTDESKLPLLSKVALAFTRTKNADEKRLLVSFVGHKSRSSVVAMGFTGLGHDMHSRVKKAVTQDGFEYGSMVQLKQTQNGGAPTITDEEHNPDKKRNLYDLYGEAEYSYISSQRYSKAKASLLEEEPTRNLQVPWSTVGLEAERRGICCRNAAIAPHNVPKWVCKSSRCSDYCVCCNALRVLIIKEPAFIAKIKNRYIGNAALALQDLKDSPNDARAILALDLGGLLSVTDEYALTNLARCLDVLEFHRYCAEWQRAMLDQNRNLTKGGFVKLILVQGDFSTSLMIGGGMCEVKGVFHEKKPVSAFNFTIWIWGCQEPVRCVLLSRCVNHDAYTAVFGFEKVFALIKQRLPDKFKECTELQMWSDAGTHFRNKEMAGFVEQNATKYKKGTEQNFMERYHGKDDYDRTAQKVALYKESFEIHIAENEGKKRSILTEQELRAGLLHSHARVQHDRAAKNLPTQDLWVEIYTVDDLKAKQPTRKILRVPEITSTNSLRCEKGTTEIINCSMTGASGKPVGTPAFPAQPKVIVYRESLKVRDLTKVKYARHFLRRDCIKENVRPKPNEQDHTKIQKTEACQNALFGGMKGAALLNYGLPSERVLSHRVDLPTTKKEKTTQVRKLLRTKHQYLYWLSQEHRQWVLGRSMGCTEGACGDECAHPDVHKDILVVTYGAEQFDGAEDEWGWSEATVDVEGLVRDAVPKAPAAPTVELLAPSIGDCIFAAAAAGIVQGGAGVAAALQGVLVA